MTSAGIDARRAGQGGFTITEVVVACALTAALLAMVSTTVVSVASVSSDNNQALRRDAQRRDVLTLVRRELEGTSLEAREVVIAPDRRSISFSTLLGATQIGAEVSGLWSSTIEIALVGDSVVRSQDGISAVLARGIRELTFEIPPGEPFVQVTCVSRHDGRETSRTIRVYPQN